MALDSVLASKLRSSNICTGNFMSVQLEKFLQQSISTPFTHTRDVGIFSTGLCGVKFVQSNIRHHSKIIPESDSTWALSTTLSQLRTMYNKIGVAHFSSEQRSLFTTKR